MIKIKPSAAKCIAALFRNATMKRPEITGYWLAKESGQTNPMGYRTLDMLDAEGFFTDPEVGRRMCESYLRACEDYRTEELRVAAAFPDSIQRAEYFKRALYYWQCQTGDPLSDALRATVTQWINEGTRKA